MYIKNNRNNKIILIYNKSNIFFENKIDLQ